MPQHSQRKKSTIAILGILVFAGGLVVSFRLGERRALAKIADTQSAVPTPESAEVRAQRLRRELEAALQENRALRAAGGREKPASVDTIEGRVAALKDMLRRLPDQAIPELSFATEGDWFAAADGSLETTEDVRAALSKLRSSAQGRFAAKMQPALKAYLAAHAGEFPQHATELKPYFDGDVSEAALSRYVIVPASEVKNVRMGGDWAITQASLVDSEYDSRNVIGPLGHGSSFKPPEAAVLEPVVAAYRASHNGQAPDDPSALLPYATSPQQKTAIDRLKQRLGR